MSSYPTNISFIQSGEPITAEVAGRPDKQLANRTDALKKQLDSSAAFQAIVAYSVPIDSSCEVGMPVYWNEDYSWFSPASVGVQEGCDSGSFETSKCADVIGLIYKKLTNTTADLILFGVIDFPEIKSRLNDIGRFYLGYEPGSLTHNSPVVEVPLGSVIGPKDPCDTGYYIFVNPEYARRHFNHQHFTKELKTLSANWISTDDEAGAPTGAVYKYDIDEVSFKKLFPPIPTSAYSFEIDWMDEDETAGYKIAGSDIILLNNYGIWWMTGDASPVGKKIRLNYSRIDYANNNTVVTSLQPGEESPIVFTDCADEESKSGDLYAKLVVSDTQIVSTDYNGKALQSIDSQLKQHSIPAVHGIVPGNGNVIIKSTNDFIEGAKTYQSGLLTISAKTYSKDYELQPQVVKLEDAIESTWNSIPYIAFPYNRTSSIISKMEIPGTFGNELTLAIRFLMLAPIVGTWSGFTVEYMRIPRPSAVNTAESTAPWLGFMSIGTIGANQSVTRSSTVELQTENISVSEGDTIILRVRRAAESGYAANIGIIRMNGILNTGE